MTVAASSSDSIARQQRGTIIAIVAGLSLSLGIFAAGATAGFRINMTASEPLGLWRIRPLGRPVSVGDLVFICPPVTPQFVEALARGYLRRGSCPSGIAPLIKTVVAIDGQRVEIDKDVRVDGRPIPKSRVERTDGNGRVLRAYSGGIVPAGNVFLHSPYTASWDSRYFGPIPASGILGQAQEMLTYAP
ncbi:conjugative transfer signal peptidase TraF [Mesorhizobium sp. SP-1A]|uniref:conjugative transfer signal peptidase TraF n=1 Tax=Mesorhizobium sp. SP-1A TaxID=3077840 RepID=UPI0028F7470C|nr:conjugative transfer signal peptidase TraF [Mesorhizobium sp. SP-1A]